MGGIHGALTPLQGIPAAHILPHAQSGGVPEKQAPDMVKNFISCISNPALFSPTIYLNPEILDYEGKKLIHIHILPSAEVHSYKK